MARRSFPLAINLLFCMLNFFGLSVKAAPSFVNSIGIDGDLLQALCKELNGGVVECEFIQVALTTAAKEADLEIAIARAKQEAQERGFEGLKEACGLFDQIGVAIEYLDDGRDELAREHLSKLPNYDASRGFDEFKAMGRSARRDLMAMVRAFGRFCTSPSEKTLVDIAILEHQKNMRTCQPRISTWKDRFVPVSDRIWSLASNEPHGVCGVVRLDRFECEDSGLLCTYISEKRVLNKDGNILGLGEGSCGNLDETVYEYRWNNSELYLSCDIIKF